MFLVRARGSSFTGTFTPLTIRRIIQELHISVQESSAEMIVIGIDPGLARLGYGVIEVTKGDIRMVYLWMYRNIGQGSPRFREIIKNIYCSRSTF